MNQNNYWFGNKVISIVTPENITKSSRFVPISQICKIIGINASSQQRRIEKHKYINTQILYIKTPCDNIKRKYRCILLSHISLWFKLFRDKNIQSYSSKLLNHLEKESLTYYMNSLDIKKIRSIHTINLYNNDFRYIVSEGNIYIITDDIYKALESSEDIDNYLDISKYMFFETTMGEFECLSIDLLSEFFDEFEFSYLQRINLSMLAKLKRDLGKKIKKTIYEELKGLSKNKKVFKKNNLQEYLFDLNNPYGSEINQIKHLVNKYVLDLSRFSDEDDKSLFSTTWNILYDILKVKTNINFKKEKEKIGADTILEIVKEKGYIEELLDIAKKELKISDSIS